MKSKIINATTKILDGKDLEFDEVQEVIRQITEGKATNAQIASFLTALRFKGETVQEITAAATVMQDKCITINTDTPEAIDIVGTGGDCAGTFNISTAAAFIAAGAGCKVAKHGNRSASSKTGAADLLEAFGVDINLPPDKSLDIFKKTGICFLYAPDYHPCMQYVSPVRQEIGIRTLFNILGPLINPAKTKIQMIGVYDRNLTEPVAKVLKNLGISRGMTVHGADGLDEATITDKTFISEIKDNKIISYEISPEDFGLKRAVLKDIQGGNTEENAAIIADIFSGKEKGAKYDIAALNAALLIYLTGNSKDIKEGIERAKAAIDSSSALKIFENFISLSKKK